MMESVSEQSSRSLLECSVCLSVFQQPRCLSCLHSFCLSCLQSVLSRSTQDQGQIRCPTCRQDSSLPSGGLEKLPHNVYLDEMLTIYRTSKTCCSKHPLERINIYCCECLKGVCYLCYKADHRSLAGCRVRKSDDWSVSSVSRLSVSSSDDCTDTTWRSRQDSGGELRSPTVKTSSSNSFSFLLRGNGGPGGPGGPGGGGVEAAAVRSRVEEYRRKVEEEQHSEMRKFDERLVKKCDEFRAKLSTEVEQQREKLRDRRRKLTEDQERFEKEVEDRRKKLREEEERIESAEEEKQRHHEEKIEQQRRAFEDRLQKRYGEKVDKFTSEQRKQFEKDWHRVRSMDDRLKITSYSEDKVTSPRPVMTRAGRVCEDDDDGGRFERMLCQAIQEKKGRSMLGQGSSVSRSFDERRLGGLGGVGEMERRHLDDLEQAQLERRLAEERQERHALHEERLRLERERMEEEEEAQRQEDKQRVEELREELERRYEEERVNFY